jgi:glycosyltransferase involved in cell wall biosynthesis
MEIIHLILGKANPMRMNGVNKVVHEMATNQVLRGYPVEVWGITAKPVHDYPARNFTTRLFRSRTNPFHIDPELKRALLEKTGKIVVHIHGAFLPVFYSVSRLLHREHIPFIITPHSTYNKVMMKKNALLKKFYFLFFERHLLNRASVIHLLGKSEQEGLDAIYNNKKSKLIPYGFSRESNPAPVKKADIFTVAYCGRMTIFSKGLDILLEGFALFNRRHPNTRLVLIGDGKDKETLRGLCRGLGISSSVLFTGGLFGEEKIKMLRESHVFAHPSRSDGLPATILEAAALGLPCVVSDATNMSRQIDLFDAGYAMKDLDPDEFCKGLEEMYARIEVAGGVGALEHNAWCMIDTSFDWSWILTEFNCLYRRSLEQIAVGGKQQQQNLNLA